MDIRTYLVRINCDKDIRCDIQSLVDLHRAHLLTVPFENLDIHAGLPIQLNEQALWDKIVIRRRGGFCYELNGLFAWLLKQIGFEVTYLNGRVYNNQGMRGREFDHLALLVRTPSSKQSWLADVGFGDSFLEPLRFEDQGEQIQGLRAYRIESVDKGFDLWQRDYDGNWERQYFFDLQPRIFPADYVSACHYHQTSPLSSFTQGHIISQAKPDGRISLDNIHLTITINGKRLNQALKTKEEFERLLAGYFSIEL